MVREIVTTGLGPPRAVLARGLDAPRWALRTAAGPVTRGALAGLDMLLASELAEEAARRIYERVLAGPELEAAVAEAVESPAMERLVARVVDSRLMEATAARLLESEELWLMVQEVAQSPAVTSAITQQGASFADDVASEVREQSQHADAWIERAARRVLRREPRAGPRPGMPDPGPA
ncbi:hypothetical protein [Conexibacter woesei]|uniref:Uncharacterized protein n=1 Tax=Conexibacter woesei (strain DSM 14684 / CCUG 47730 / CIP 108061 / JCM 11494 / NBRC 100937 / ID131577) TaxID=469383 RepID=D3EZV0_CONWI|nr:hypothetical protein [Conexibacter woesei]ADB49926.1 hypothetical protein Cwoe_1498 [Conexibacter woesei DSM 14684]